MLLQFQKTLYFLELWYCKLENQMMFGLLGLHFEKPNYGWNDGLGILKTNLCLYLWYWNLEMQFMLGSLVLDIQKTELVFGTMVLECRKPIQVWNYGLVIQKTNVFCLNYGLRIYKTNVCWELSWILENQIMFGFVVLEFRNPIYF